jgi:hypothetical protein
MIDTSSTNQPRIEVENRVIAVSSDSGDIELFKQ